MPVDSIRHSLGVWLIITYFPVYCHWPILVVPSLWAQVSSNLVFRSPTRLMTTLVVRFIGFLWSRSFVYEHWYILDSDMPICVLCGKNLKTQSNLAPHQSVTWRQKCRTRSHPWKGNFWYSWLTVSPNGCPVLRTFVNSQGTGVKMLVLMQFISLDATLTTSYA